MEEKRCKCGEYRFYLQYKGHMVGKYCSGCNKWQRWVGKKDLEQYRRKGLVVFKEVNNTKSTVSNTKEDILAKYTNCRGCGSKDFYLRYRGEAIGKYCSKCDRWSFWVGKKDLAELQSIGYIVHEESYINPNLEVSKSPVKNEGTPTNVVSEEVVMSECSKCGGIGFYLKERGNNTGKYCVNCNRWLKWIGKQERQLLESKGFKVHDSDYISQLNTINKDAKTKEIESNRYIEVPEGSIKDTRVSSGDLNLNTVDINKDTYDTNINTVEPNTNNVDCTINNLNILSPNTDLGIEEKECNQTNLDINTVEIEDKMKLLELFLSKADYNCEGCVLESKCEMMVVKLCDSIKDAIEFVEETSIW